MHHPSFTMHLPRHSSTLQQLPCPLRGPSPKQLPARPGVNPPDLPPLRHVPPFPSAPPHRNCPSGLHLAKQTDGSFVIASFWGSFESRQGPIELHSAKTIQGLQHRLAARALCEKMCQAPQRVLGEFWARESRTFPLPNCPCPFEMAWIQDARPSSAVVKEQEVQAAAWARSEALEKPCCFMASLIGVPVPAALGIPRPLSPKPFHAQAQKITEGIVHSELIRCLVVEGDVGRGDLRAASGTGRHWKH